MWHVRMSLCQSRSNISHIQKYIFCILVYFSRIRVINNKYSLFEHRSTAEIIVLVESVISNF